MALIDSSTVVISWAGAELTDVEDCNGINLEYGTKEMLPYHATLKKKAVTGIQIADDVTFKVPMNDTGGSSYAILEAARRAKTEAAFKVAYGATYYRQLNMTCIKLNPVPGGGDVVMVEVTLVNTGTAVTQN